MAATVQGQSFCQSRLLLLRALLQVARITAGYASQTGRIPDETIDLILGRKTADGGFRPGLAFLGNEYGSARDEGDAQPVAS